MNPIKDILLRVSLFQHLEPLFLSSSTRFSKGLSELTLLVRCKNWRSCFGGFYMRDPY